MVPFVLVTHENYDGVTNHQVMAALCGRLGGFAWGECSSFVLYFSLFAMDALHLFFLKKKVQD